MPTIDPGPDALPAASPLVNEDHNATAGPGPSSRFSRYLASLSGKPSGDPTLDFLDSELSSVSDLSSMTHRRSGSTGIGQAASSVSLASMAELRGDLANPEADSYTYMETLLEALATLGRLGLALETVAQRVPGEIHALVELTLDEVEDR